MAHPLAGDVIWPSHPQLCVVGCTGDLVYQTFRKAEVLHGLLGQALRCQIIGSP